MKQSTRTFSPRVAKTDLQARLSSGAQHIIHMRSLPTTAASVPICAGLTTLVTMPTVGPLAWVAVTALNAKPTTIATAIASLPHQCMSAPGISAMPCRSHHTRLAPRGSLQCLADHTTRRLADFARWRQFRKTTRCKVDSVHLRRLARSADEMNFRRRLRPSDIAKREPTLWGKRGNRS